MIKQIFKVYNGYFQEKLSHMLKNVIWRGSVYYFQPLHQTALLFFPTPTKPHTGGLWDIISYGHIYTDRANGQIYKCLNLWLIIQWIVCFCLISRVCGLIIIMYTLSSWHFINLHSLRWISGRRELLSERFSLW